MGKILPLALLFTVGVSALAQEFTIPVSAPSETGSPVALHGSLTATNDLAGDPSCPCTASLSLVNVSGKRIVILITELVSQIEVAGVVRSRFDYRGIDDYFFKADLFEPNATKIVETRIIPYGEEQHQGEPAEVPPQLKAMAQVIFAQFADGSTWGDLAAAKEPLKNRLQAWNELLSLANIYRTQGEQRVLAALKEPDASGPYLGSLISVPASVGHLEPLILEMDTLLRMGELRLRDMDSSVAPRRNGPR